MAGPVIRIHNAVVVYREGPALQGVSLEVTEGEFVGIIGPNGAGKTTLLKTVNGMAHLHSGRAVVLGQELNGFNGNRLRKYVGYVSQVRTIDPRLPISVRETVTAGTFGRLGWFHRPGEAEKSKVEAVLEIVGLSRLATRPLGHLSGGEQQKVSIARVLAQEPRVLLLDELTTSLDRDARRDILDLIRMIHESRRLTTVFVTHDFEALPSVCHRVVLMKSGQIYRDGSRDSVLNGATLSPAFCRTESGTSSPA